MFESRTLVEGVSPPIITPLITFSEELPAIEELAIENLHSISIGLTIIILFGDIIQCNLT